MSPPILPKHLPPAAKNLFVKRFLDFQKFLIWGQSIMKTDSSPEKTLGHANPFTKKIVVFYSCYSTGFLHNRR